MYSQISSTKMDKAMKPDQFDRVVEAILAGKYSWACVLILRFAGYNPLHYIPYRTYNRLLKDNTQASPSSSEKSNNLNATSAGAATGKIKDLAYMETVNKQHSLVRGGSGHGLHNELDLDAPAFNVGFMPPTEANSTFR